MGETMSELNGLKFPNSATEGSIPVMTKALTKNGPLGGFNELLPFIMSSPNQEDAGSCLYMAITGNVEWHLAKQNPNLSRKPNGPIDLSERYLMNIAGLEEDDNGVENWKTDTIYLYNNKGHGILNSHFPYKKGYYKDGENGYEVSNEVEPNSEYGTAFNWIDTREEITQNAEVPLPEFKRNIIFKDPASNQWNVGITPMDIVDQVKNALITNKAPVLVMYNHYGYWHVNMIVGFDDKLETKGCEFTKGTAPYLASQAEDYRRRAEREQDPKVKERLINRAKKSEGIVKNLNDSWEKIGGCHNKGMFYVRDSLYSDPNEPMYDYGTPDKKDDRHLVKKVILREYEYLRVLSNHIIQILPL